MRNAGLDGAQAGIKIEGRQIPKIELIKRKQQLRSKRHGHETIGWF